MGSGSFFLVLGEAEAAEKASLAPWGSAKSGLGG